jgi:hypothetical protein
MKSANESQNIRGRAFYAAFVCATCIYFPFLLLSLEHYFFALVTGLLVAFDFFYQKKILSIKNITSELTKIIKIIYGAFFLVLALHFLAFISFDLMSEHRLFISLAYLAVYCLNFILFSYLASKDPSVFVENSSG